MKTSSLWLLCLFGVALLNKGWCRPSDAIEDDYLQDGEDGDYDGDEEEDTEDQGPQPVIKSTPISLNVDIGGVAFFPCDVEGNPEIYTRIWRKDSVGLFLGNVRQVLDPRINNLNNGSLEIRQIEASDSGTYSCKISVGSDEVTHTLKVNSPAKIVKVIPEQKVVMLKQGSILALECIAQGNPAPSIHWYRNDHILEDQDPSIQGARYTINNASSHDAGFYKCTASNGHVPDERVLEVQVHYPPEIQIARAVVPTGEGYESELRCTVTGSKKPQVKWYKDGESRPIETTRRIKLERNAHDHILRITKTESSDFGEYTCEAKNSEGSASAIIRLTGKPSRPVLDTHLTEKGSKNPLLVFKVESFAPIEKYELLYKKDTDDEWLVLNPEVVPVSEGSRIYIVKHTLNVQPGVYSTQLKAKNSYGWSEFSSAETVTREHDENGETGLYVKSMNDGSAPASASSPELRISVALLVSLIVAHFYC